MLIALEKIYYQKKTMRIYINSANENWVVDRFINEWNQFNYKKSRHFFFKDQIIWLIAPWAWKKIPNYFLKVNKVVCTIHHIDEEKFDYKLQSEFNERDQYVDCYHVISDKTLNQVKKLTNKPIAKIPFWVNQNIWFPISTKNELKQKYGFDKETYLIGSFQRDTEGKDLISPKLSKGPDQFLKIAEYLNNKYNNLEVVLSGKRRNYLIKNLKSMKIPYKYFEMASFTDLNELYNLLDLYIVSSRYEGGPQSILECAITKTPIISTDVGIASEILSRKSIYNMDNFNEATPDIVKAYENVQKFKIPFGFENFNKLFEELSES